jgi:hypothetical protein
LEVFFSVLLSVFALYNESAVLSPSLATSQLSNIDASTLQRPAGQKSLRNRSKFTKSDILIAADIATRTKRNKLISTHTLRHSESTLDDPCSEDQSKRQAVAA